MPTARTVEATAAAVPPPATESVAATPTVSGILLEEQLQQKSVMDLRKILKSQKQQISGKKDELVSRILQFQNGSEAYGCHGSGRSNINQSLNQSNISLTSYSSMNQSQQSMNQSSLNLNLNQSTLSNEKEQQSSQNQKDGQIEEGENVPSEEIPRLTTFLILLPVPSEEIPRSSVPCSLDGLTEAVNGPSLKTLTIHSVPPKQGEGPRIKYQNQNQNQTTSQSQQQTQSQQQVTLRYLLDGVEQQQSESSEQWQYSWKKPVDPNENIIRGLLVPDNSSSSGNNSGSSTSNQNTPISASQQQNQNQSFNYDNREENLHKFCGLDKEVVAKLSETVQQALDPTTYSSDDVEKEDFDPFKNLLSLNMNDVITTLSQSTNLKTEIKEKISDIASQHDQDDDEEELDHNPNINSDLMLSVCKQHFIKSIRYSHNHLLKGPGFDRDEYRNERIEKVYGKGSKIVVLRMNPPIFYPVRKNGNGSKSKQKTTLSQRGSVNGESESQQNLSSNLSQSQQRLSSQNGRLSSNGPAPSTSVIKSNQKSYKANLNSKADSNKKTQQLLAQTAVQVSVTAAKSSIESADTDVVMKDASMSIITNNISPNTESILNQTLGSNCTATTACLNTTGVSTLNNSTLTVLQPNGNNIAAQQYQTVNNDTVSLDQSHPMVTATSSSTVTAAVGRNNSDQINQSIQNNNMDHSVMFFDCHEDGNKLIDQTALSINLNSSKSFGRDGDGIDKNNNSSLLQSMNQDSINLMDLSKSSQKSKSEEGVNIVTEAGQNTVNEAVESTNLNTATVQQQVVESLNRDSSQKQVENIVSSDVQESKPESDALSVNETGKQPENKKTETEDLLKNQNLNLNQDSQISNTSVSEFSSSSILGSLQQNKIAFNDLGQNICNMDNILGMHQTQSVDESQQSNISSIIPGIGAGPLSAQSQQTENQIQEAIQPQSSLSQPSVTTANTVQMQTATIVTTVTTDPITTTMTTQSSTTQGTLKRDRQSQVSQQVQVQQQCHNDTSALLDDFDDYLPIPPEWERIKASSIKFSDPSSSSSQQLNDNPNSSQQQNCNSYEMSSEYENSDDSPDRSEKFVPEWSKTWAQTVHQQKQVDPDSVFGAYMRQVNLLEVFGGLEGPNSSATTNRILDEVKLATRENKRNSLDVHVECPGKRWSRDKLRKEEILNYKRAMGQTIRREDLWRKPGDPGYMGVNLKKVDKQSGYMGVNVKKVEK